jgi:hypothetical protein
MIHFHIGKIVFSVIGGRYNARAIHTNANELIVLAAQKCIFAAVTPVADYPVMNSGIVTDLGGDLTGVDVGIACASGDRVLKKNIPWRTCGWVTWWWRSREGAVFQSATMKDGFGDTRGSGYVAFEGIREGDTAVSVLPESGGYRIFTRGRPSGY